MDKAGSVASAGGCGQDGMFVWHDEAVLYTGLAAQQVHQWEYASDGSERGQSEARAHGTGSKGPAALGYSRRVSHQSPRTVRRRRSCGVERCQKALHMRKIAVWSGKDSKENVAQNLTDIVREAAQLE